MEIRLVKYTNKVQKDCERAEERVYMVKDYTGAPIGKVTFRDRLMTFEAVGTSLFPMETPAHIKIIESIFDDMDN